MVASSISLHLSLSRPNFAIPLYKGVNNFAFVVGTRVEKETNKLFLTLMKSTKVQTIGEMHMRGILPIDGLLLCVYSWRAEGYFNKTHQEKTLPSLVRARVN